MANWQGRGGMGSGPPRCVCRVGHLAQSTSDGRLVSLPHAVRPSLVVDGESWRLAEEPRRWQTEALDVWQAHADRGVVAVTTGAGKTFFAFMCVLDLLRREPDIRVVILVPTLALLDQWYVGLQEALGVTDMQIAVYSGRTHAVEPARVNLMVINTARELAQGVSGEKTFLIVDECHRASGPINSKALEGQHVATLGLSATPEGTYDDAFERRVSPHLGLIIYRYDYDDARADGVIVPFSLANVRVRLTAEEQKKYEGLSNRIAKARSEERRGADVEERIKRLLITRAAVAATARNRVPVAIRLARDTAGSRTIIFHERVDAAEAIYIALRAAGLSAALYHSRMSDPLRRSNLRLFRRGGTDVLVTCRALDEGFNVPEARVAIIASSTASPRQRIQRLGRILRPARGKHNAVVYTIYATDAEEARLAAEAGAMEDLADVTWIVASPRTTS